MKKQKPQRNTRKKKTKEQAKKASLKNKSFQTNIKKEKEKMATFSWSEVTEFYKNANNLFRVVEPIRAAMDDEALLERIRSKGRYETFIKLSGILRNELNAYGVRLDEIYAQHKERDGTVVLDPNSDTYIDEANAGLSISIQYQEWTESFQTTIVDGLALDLLAIINTAYLQDEQVVTEESKDE